MGPTRAAAWLAAAIALSALFIPTVVAGLALVALGAAIVADANAVRKRPRASVDLPGLLSRGISSAYYLETSSSRTEVRLPIVPDLKIEPNEGPSPLSGRLTAVRRGHHVIPAPAVRVTGPLALGRWTHRVGADHEITVYPDMPAARRLASLVREGRFWEERTRGPLGLGTDFESIREYVPDDDIRRINWAATSRTGRPMTNQYRVEQDRDVICLIDCGRLMASPLHDRTRIDAAVDAAVAVGLVADVEGDHSGVLAFDSQVRRHLRPRRNGGLSMVRAIYDLEASQLESDYELAFRTISKKRSLVIVFTDIFEESAARPLIDAVPVLCRHHHVIVASATDPDLLSILGSDPGTVEEVYRAVVAAELLAVRKRIARALDQAGAEVVEAAPQALGAACVRLYLRAKARVRL